MKTFSDFGVDQRVCAALADGGIVHPFPIQELTLPLALTGADLIGQARTGTGKTLAFGIPLIERALRSQSNDPVALVIVPTRELCLQVRDDLATAAAQTDVAVLAVYGGKSIDAQVESLESGADIVVGTPGRLLDLLRRGSLNLSGVSGLVLDEADEMLDLGFLPDVEQLIEATAAQRQTLLFSATMPGAVVALARRYMNKPTFMRADVEEVRIAPDTVQHFFSCHRMDKPAVLARILSSPGRGRCVVFSRTKRMADVLVQELREQGVNAAAIHSDLRQDARERALQGFRTGKTDVLVATEVAARGLDITDVTHVVNYDCPDDEKMYLHRIGRTGRAGAAGIAITLAVWNELARLEMIKKTLGITTETIEVFSTSPILQELFDLPPSGRAARKPAEAPEPAPRAPASSEDDEQPVVRRRSGRRGGSGRRSGAAATPVEADAATPAPTDTAPEAEPVPSAPAASDDTPEESAPAAADTAGDTAEGVRRVRTRRRATAAPAPRPAAAPPQREAREASDTASDTPEAAAPERAPRQRNRPAAGDRGGRGTAASSDRGGSSARSGRRPAPDRGARSGSRGSRSPRSGSPRPSATVDPAVARGTGRPRLARPLVISYLP